MNPTAVDLLVRVVAKELAEQRCERCSNSLADARIAVRDVKSDQVVVEAKCRACEHAVPLQIRPDADGVARIG